MSIRRIGVRSTAVGLGVLASMALMAAPSWAAKGGNSANAALCEAGGYAGVLLAQDGSAFKNEGKCTSYAAKGGQLVGLDVVAGAASGGFFPVTCSGFGVPVPPGAFGECQALYTGGSGESIIVSFPIASTFSVSSALPCELSGSHLVSLGLSVVDKTGAKVLFNAGGFPLPSGC